MKVEQEVTLAAGMNDVTLHIPASQTQGVKLWHPHGHGAQPLYNITATFTQAHRHTGTAAAAAATTTRRVGFRHVALITVNDTDPTAAAAAARANGTGSLFSNYKSKWRKHRDFLQIV